MVSFISLLTSRHVSDYVISSLTRCGLIHQATHVFMEFPHRSVFSWTTLISASLSSEALKLYELMQEDGVQPNNYTLVSLFKACESLPNGLVHGKKLHGFAIKTGLSTDPYVACALVRMYGKFRFLLDSESVFSNSIMRESVSIWNEMLSVYVEHGQAKKALLLYRQMKVECGISANRATCMALFQACGILGGSDGDGNSNSNGEADGDGYCAGDCDITDGRIWLQIGRALHADAQSKSLHLLDDVPFATTLVDMYSKCSAIQDAEHVFSALSVPDVVSWNTLLSGYLEQQGDLVLCSYRRMHEQGIVPNAYTMVFALKACAMFAEKEKASLIDGQRIKAMGLEIGQALHVDLLAKDLLSGSRFIATSLMNMYNNCGDLRKVEEIFVAFSQRDIIAWNTMLSAYVQHGFAERALLLYRQIHEENVGLNYMSFVCACRACTILTGSEEPESLCEQSNILKTRSLEVGQSVYSDAGKRGLASSMAPSLIVLCGKCGAIEEATHVFLSSPDQDVVMWTSLLSAYVDSKQKEKALQLFRHMQVRGVIPNRHSFVCALKGCGSFDEGEETERGLTSLLSLEICRALHADITKRSEFLSDTILNTTLLTVYAECGSIKEASTIFSALPYRDTVSWNVMLSTYVSQGEGEKALRLYRDMQTEKAVIQDQRTMELAIRACGMLQLSDKDILLEIANALHMDAIKEGYTSETSFSSMLISMYWKCGILQKAKDVLLALSEPTPSAWNALLFAYNEDHQYETVLKLYDEMLNKGIAVNEYSFIGILQSCSEIGSLNSCKCVHFDIVSTECDKIPRVASSLIQAYGKCASTIDSQEIFEGFDEPDIVVWTACIQGYSGEGNALCSLCMYERLKMSSLYPDQVSFNCILLACVRDGLVRESIEYFKMMIRECETLPGLVHYGILIDGLGRAGDFRRLERLLMSMPMPVDVNICVSVLTACRAHGDNIELAEMVFDWAVDLALKQEVSVYILMSNIYTNAGFQSHIAINESEG